MIKKLDLIGQKFNRLLILSFNSIDKYGYYLYNCLCDCGKEIIASGSKVKRGSPKSCGCLTHEIFKSGVSRKHGLSHTITYNSWTSMIRRCTIPTNDNYYLYGGRNITVCNRWLESFENFYEDMGPRSEGTTLDRIDVDGNYEPSNCRWATQTEQSNNARSVTKTKDRKLHRQYRNSIQVTLIRLLFGRVKESIFIKYFGCSVEELKNHISSQFEPWMNWDNFGTGKNKWCIDHIIPVNQFDLSIEKNRYDCFNYKNLRPLRHIKNIRRPRIYSEI